MTSNLIEKIKNALGDSELINVQEVESYLLNEGFDLLEIGVNLRFERHNKKVIYRPGVGWFVFFYEKMKGGFISSSVEDVRFFLN